MQKYRTTLNENQINMVRTQRQTQIKKEWVGNKQGIAKTLLGEFPNLGTVDAVRHKVWYLINQFEEEFDRPTSMNDFAEDEKMVAKNILHGWIHKTDENGKKTGTYFVKNPQYTQEVEDLHVALIEEMKQYAPVYPLIERAIPTDWHLLVLDPADIHIGKLCEAFETGEEYNSQIAVQRVREWVEGILHRCAGYNIEKILFIGGNDILHVDNPKSSTTSGTHQDVSWMRYTNFLMGKKLMVDILEMLLTIADVHFIYCPSNHDYMSGFMLCDSIASRFSKNPNITFDSDMKHRKYYRYYNNLIWVTHWDGAKEKDLPLLMAQESPDWSDTRRRYILWHHVHHFSAKDYIGVTYQTLRSPSGCDSRHHRNWYQYSPVAVEWFLHHPQHWQIAKFSHFF